MRKFSFLLIPLLLVLAACPKQGTPVEPSHAADQFDVQKLFTVDGCTVYRFWDSRAHYFTKCVESVRVVTDTTTTYLSGKTYVEESNINVTEPVK